MQFFTAQKSIGPPSFSFNFSVNDSSAIKNPFEGEPGKASSNGWAGFQGNFFSIPAATNPELARPVPDTPEHNLFIHGNNNNQPHIQAFSTETSFGGAFAVAQQTASPANPFASFGSQPTSSNFSYDQTSSQVLQQQPASNVFGSTYQPTANVFGQAANQLQPGYGVSNAFNQFSSLPLQRQSTSFAFGQASSRTHQPPVMSNMFGVTPGPTQEEFSKTDFTPSLHNPQDFTAPTFEYSNASGQAEAQEGHNTTAAPIAHDQCSSSIFSSESQTAPQTQCVSNDLFDHSTTSQARSASKLQSTPPPMIPQLKRPRSPDLTKDGAVVGFMPAVIPSDLTEIEKRELVTGYRIRSMSYTLSKHLQGTKPLDPREIEYFMKVCNDILNANGLPMSMPGLTQDSTDGQVNDATNPCKRPKRNGTFANDEGTSLTTIQPSCSGAEEDGMDLS
jgi:hypothetical protein